MSAIAPSSPGPVLIDELSDLSVVMGGGSIAKPSGPYADIMVGPGAWPDFDESEFTTREGILSALKSAAATARENWNAVRACIFNGPLVWVGGSATAAAAKAEEHSNAMQEIEKQFTDAIEWCGTAFLTTRMAKKAIADYVETQVQAINDLLNKAKEKDADADEAAQAAENIAKLAYAANKQFLDGLASSLSGRAETAGDAQPDDGHAAPLDTNSGAPGPTHADSKGSGSKPQGPTSQTDNLRDKEPGSEQQEDRPSNEAERGGGGDAPLNTLKADADVSEGVGREGGGEGGGDAPLNTLNTGADVSQGFSGDAPGLFSPGIGQTSTGTKPPTSPAPPSIPTAPSAPSLGGAGGGSSAASAASGPLSSAASAASGAGSGLDPSQAAAGAEALAGRAPVDPIQQFSQGLADSAGTPVHSASAGGSAPPPLAPSPTVPAGDTMSPASTGAATSVSSAQAPAAPVQAPASGGGMGMGGGMPMGSPPLGPPPTAPPAAPVPPPTAAAPPPGPVQPATIAGGAQVAPIPVSAARAERDAAQNAAKRTGSGPLELARRIAAALNAPDMANVEDFNFFWITAVTVDGRIAVANNYGLGYFPAQVNLPDQVVMVSADESISPAERATWATYPILAVQRWAQENDTTLRAVIALEHQFTNADSGVHQEVLAPEDIPAKGKMAGRDRLQVISPQISGRLAQIGDGDLVKILPPAPVDSNPPEDRRSHLWDKVWQPLFSGASNRGQVHLQAFLAYAAHAQEWAVYEAHAVGDGPGQRRAVADFIYWQHIGQLVADAIAE
ncbi:hypothetical protein [Mycobacterium sp. GA-1841]|uniref:hypothetical protein n=1 Tax=Mycobacterium sp. GA-1841 TaxID=1834154 RepID=UPI0020CA04BE|nr:hypothetical protein [Mycobacterium sp. GA-1841]